MQTRTKSDPRTELIDRIAAQCIETIMSTPEEICDQYGWHHLSSDAANSIAKSAILAALARYRICIEEKALGNTKMAFIADAPCAKCNLHHYNIHVKYDEPANDGGDWYVAIDEPNICECDEPMKYVHVPPPSYYLERRIYEADRKVPG